MNPAPDDDQEQPHPRSVWTADQRAEGLDVLVREEPLELRVAGSPLAVVMRTPGHDVDLGLGFALTERLMSDRSQLWRARHCTTAASSDAAEAPAASENVLLLTPPADAQVDLHQFQRRLYASSSCGVCGKRTIEQALREAPPLRDCPSFEARMLARLPAILRAQQPTFEVTGGLHAAGLFNRAGELLVVREDIGRHNAVDKVVGWALRGQVSLRELGVVVSGRASYEVVQKALAAELSCVVAVGAVSSLAAELAQRGNIALIGFARAERMSIYVHGDRIR